MRVFQNLRLYDFDASVLRLEAPSEAALLDCCFQQDDSVAFTLASDGFIRRFSSLTLVFYLFITILIIITFVERGKIYVI
jgi:hypothetical protein